MNNVDAYINTFSGEVKVRLLQLRALIHAEVPAAEETISYGLIGYKLNGKPLVYFGGFARHIGFYATPRGHEAFAAELTLYKQGKGSVQFPLDKPLPIDLITKMVQFKKQDLEA